MRLDANLITKSLLITTFVEADCNEKYVSWLNNAEINRYLEARFSKHTFESSINYVRNCLLSNSTLFCKVERLSIANDIIGTCTLRFDENHKTAEIGIMIGDSSAHKLVLERKQLDLWWIYVSLHMGLESCMQKCTI